MAKIKFFSFIWLFHDLFQKGVKATLKGYVSERKGINLCRSVFVVQLISNEVG